MAYDPNSWQAQMGALGEDIVKRLLESRGYTAKKPADTFASGASIVDFEVNNKLCTTVTWFVEVKVQSAFPFGVEKALCYSFPKSRIDAYIDYGKVHNKQVGLFIVDPSSGFVCYSGLIKTVTCYSLMCGRTLDGRDYPFEQYNKGLGGVCYYFHRDQFSIYGEINEEDRQKLLALSQNKTAYTDKPTSPDPVDEQTALELTPPPKQTKQNTGTESNIKSLIDQFAVATGVTRKDLATAIVGIREKQFNREMEALRAMLA